MSSTGSPPPPAVELAHLAPDAGPGELVEFAWNACGGDLRPVQVKSEIRRLLEMVHPRRPRAVLEIGTAGGGSLFLLSRAAAEDAIVVSVDLPDGALSYRDSRRSLYERFGRPGQRLHLLRRDSHHPGTPREVAGLLGGRPLDLLFIDGDHRYRGVKMDFEMYAPLVAPTGLVALHDIVPLPAREEWCEVDRFWRELKAGRRHVEIVEDWNQGWAGIGVLEVP
jgi:predicted O-methyltransferase YrrM